MHVTISVAARRLADTHGLDNRSIATAPGFAGCSIGAEGMFVASNENHEQPAIAGVSRAYPKGVAPGLLFRRARLGDVAEIRKLHRISMTALSVGHYSREEIEGFFAEIDTVDPVMIEDGTYAVAEAGGRLVASGGWTMRAPSYAARLDGPVAADRTATIRSIFVHPDFARRGIGGAILERCETEAVLIGGAERLELCATLTGRPLYQRAGYRPLHSFELQLANGAVFRSVRMAKQVLEPARAAA